MEFDKNTILAFVLIGLILVIVNTDIYQKMVFGERYVEEQQQSFPENVSSDASNSDLPKSFPSKNRTNLTLTKPEPMKVVAVEKEEGREITINTPKYYGVLSTLGGTIKEWRIKKYADDNGDPVTLVKNGIGNLALSLPMDNDTLKTEGFNFSCVESHIELEAGEIKELVFESEIGTGKFIKKIYTFSGDDYSFNLTIRFENIKDIISGYSYLINWKTGINNTEKNIEENMNNSKAYSYVGEETVELDVGSSAFEEIIEEDRNIDWAGIRSKYFAVAIVPRTEPGRKVRMVGRTENIQNSDVRMKEYAIALSMPFSNKKSITHEFDIYLGPLEYDAVEKLGAELEQIMDLGWAPIRPFSIFVLWALTNLHKFIPNYGLVIILFSIMVKILLHPLTKRSYQSMAQMQTLQPEIAKLKEKHAKSPQKMNTETMKLYRDYGVNPLGGCLPMVLQMPLLIALFKVFGTTIEFRQAYFFGWITDLSAPDTIFYLPFELPLYGDSVNVLALVMCLTMVVQQKLSTTDPKQKPLIYIMPIVFAVIFNSFPSGLNLYYSLFNIFSVIQQKYMTKPVTKLEKSKKKSQKKFGKGGLHAALSKKNLSRK